MSLFFGEGVFLKGDCGGLVELCCFLDLCELGYVVSFLIGWFSRCVFEIKNGQCMLVFVDRGALPWVSKFCARAVKRITERLRVFGFEALLSGQQKSIPVCRSRCRLPSCLARSIAFRACPTRRLDVRLLRFLGRGSCIW